MIPYFIRSQSRNHSPLPLQRPDLPRVLLMSVNPVTTTVEPPICRLKVSKRSQLETTSPVGQELLRGVKHAAAWFDVRDGRRNGQRSNGITMLMGSRRPTEPPPIQMALANIGAIKGSIMCLPF